MRIHVESKDHVKEEIPEIVISRERSEASSENEQSISATAAGQDEVSTNSGTTTPKSKKESDREDVKPDTKNIAGRLNNLVSSDMANLHGGQGLMLISEYFFMSSRTILTDMLVFYVPTQLTLSTIYLYMLLGWR